MRFNVLLAACGAPTARLSLYLCGRAEVKLFGRAALCMARVGVDCSETVLGVTVRDGLC